MNIPSHSQDAEAVLAYRHLDTASVLLETTSGKYRIATWSTALNRFTHWSHATGNAGEAVGWFISRSTRVAAEERAK